MSWLEYGQCPGVCLIYLEQPQTSNYNGYFCFQTSILLRILEHIGTRIVIFGDSLQMTLIRSFFIMDSILISFSEWQKSAAVTVHQDPSPQIKYTQSLCRSWNQFSPFPFSGGQQSPGPESLLLNCHVSETAVLQSFRAVNFLLVETLRPVPGCLGRCSVIGSEE